MKVVNPQMPTNHITMKKTTSWKQLVLRRQRWGEEAGVCRRGAGAAGSAGPPSFSAPRIRIGPCPEFYAWAWYLVGRCYRIKKGWLRGNGHRRGFSRGPRGSALPSYLPGHAEGTWPAPVLRECGFPWAQGRDGVRVTCCGDQMEMSPPRCGNQTSVQA